MYNFIYWLCGAPEEAVSPYYLLLVFTRDKLNKMAGNSIVVYVLEQIFKQVDEINNTILNEME